MGTVKKVVCVNNYGYEDYLVEGKVYEVLDEDRCHYTVIDGLGSFYKRRFESVADTSPYLKPAGFAEIVEQVAKETQVGGSHYTKCGIQPYEYTLANGLGGLEHTVIKYVTRWKDKGGVEDLKKARHTLDFLIEYTEKQK